MGFYSKLLQAGPGTECVLSNCLLVLECMVRVRIRDPGEDSQGRSYLSWVVKD